MVWSRLTVRVACRDWELPSGCADSHNSVPNRGTFPLTVTGISPPKTPATMSVWERYLLSVAPRLYSSMTNHFPSNEINAQINAVNSMCAFLAVNMTLNCGIFIIFTPAMAIFNVCLCKSHFQRGQLFGAYVRL